MEQKIIRLWLFLGMVIPFLLFICIAILSVSWPSYNLITEEVSVLGSISSPFRIFANSVIFGLSGIGIVGLAVSFGKYIELSYFQKNATKLFLASGVLVFCLGFLPADRNYNVVTQTGRAHSFVGTVAVFFLLASIVWYALAFRKDERWGLLWVILSFATGLVSLVTSLVFKFVPNFYFYGILERIGIDSLLLWVSFVSLNCILIDVLKRNRI